MSLSGDMSCVEVDRSRTITNFCCSIRPMFSVKCGLNCFLVYGCRLFMFLLFLFFTTDIYTFFYLYSLPIHLLALRLKECDSKAYISAIKSSDDQVTTNPLAINDIFKGFYHKSV